MCSSIVTGPVIQVIVPVANRPAICSITVPRAATRTSGPGAVICSGPNVEALTVSPAKLTCSPASRGMSTSRYSRMWRAGLLNDIPNTFSMTIWWDSPMPSVRRPPLAACTVSAWAASITGCRG